MKLRPDDALAIASLFNSVIVAEQMAADPQFSTTRWVANAEEAAFKLLDDYGIHVIGYSLAIAKREADRAIATAEDVA